MPFASRQCYQAYLHSETNPYLMNSQKVTKVVTPAKAGVQKSLLFLDSGFRRNDRKGPFATFYEFRNLQNVKGKAKPYQIKQLLKIVEKYNLLLEDQE